MDAVAQANPNVYTQLSTCYSKQFEKRDWKFEHISYILDEMDEGVQLNQDCIVEAKNSTDEFAGEISLMETRMGSSKARTTTSCKIGPFIGPAASWEEYLKQLEYFGKWKKRRSSTTGSQWFGLDSGWECENSTIQDGESVRSLSWKRWASEISAGENWRWKTQKTSSETGTQVLRKCFSGEKQGRKGWRKSIARSETQIRTWLMKLTTQNT